MWKPPLLMATNRSPSGGEAWPKSTGPYSPSASGGPAPQHTASPLARSAQVWKSPLLTIANRWPGVGAWAATVGSSAGLGVGPCAWTAGCITTASASARNATNAPTARSRPRRRTRVASCVRIMRSGTRYSVREYYARKAPFVPSSRRPLGRDDPSNVEPSPMPRSSSTRRQVDAHPDIDTLLFQQPARGSRGYRSGSWITVHPPSVQRAGRLMRAPCDSGCFAESGHPVWSRTSLSRRARPPVSCSGSNWPTAMRSNWPLVKWRPAVGSRAGRRKGAGAHGER